MNRYENEILSYLSSIGIRAENTRANRQVYKSLMEITFDLLNNDNGINGIEYLHFIDCVAQNILNVSIYSNEYKGKPKSKFLNRIYTELKKYHDRFENQVKKDGKYCPRDI